jgi:putative holliday junction resolvase
MLPRYFSRTQSLNQPIPSCALAYNKVVMATTARTNSAAVPAETSPGSKARRILAVDYGRKRIGLALSDELGLTAQPLLTLARTNRRDDLRRLREICREHGVAHILVGHPLHITGAPGEMAEEAARFAARLKKALGIAVELVDERLTTWEAQQTMSQAKSSSPRKRRPLDDVAAAVLLRDYLQRGHESSRLAPAERA